MTEEKKTAGNELTGEKLDKVAGGEGSNDTFFCWQCRTHRPLSQQSKSNPDYCDYCYRHFISPDANPYKLPYVGVQSSLKQK